MDILKKYTLISWVSSSGTYVGYLKQMKGVMSQGRTLERLMVNIKNAFSGVQHAMDNDVKKVK